MLILAIPAFPAGGMAALGSGLIMVMLAIAAMHVFYFVAMVVLPALVMLMAVRGAVASRGAFLGGFAAAGLALGAALLLSALIDDSGLLPLYWRGIDLVVLLPLAGLVAWRFCRGSGRRAGLAMIRMAEDDPSSLLIRWRAATIMAVMLPAAAIVVAGLMNFEAFYTEADYARARGGSRALRDAQDAMAMASLVAFGLLIYGYLFRRAIDRTLREALGASQDMPIRAALAQYADDRLPPFDGDEKAEALPAAAYAALAISPFVGFLPAFVGIAFAARARSKVAGPRERWQWRLLGSIAFGGIGACVMMLAFFCVAFLAITTGFVPWQPALFYALIVAVLAIATISDMRLGLRLLTKKRDETGRRDVTGMTGPTLAASVGQQLDEGTRDIPFLQQFVVLPYKALSGLWRVLAPLLLLMCLFFPPAFIAYAIFWGAYAMKDKARREEAAGPESLSPPN